MSDDAEFLLRTRDLIADGKSAYGAVGSPKQVERLAYYDALIEHGRRAGELEPAPPVMSADLIGEQRLAREYPRGAPSYDVEEHTAEFHNTQFDQIEVLARVVLRSTRERDGRRLRAASEHDLRPVLRLPRRTRTEGDRRRSRGSDAQGR